MIKKQEDKKVVQSRIKTPRPPVIVVVGHIDHGKTLLLDYIRKTKIIEKESGGITQHIGAYEVIINAKDGGAHRATFLDTPGHEAFQEIRSRGAKVADVAILVIAADDGIKPQTEESIKTILAAKIPFIVAINKIDKEGANPEKVKSELAKREIFLEGQGGHVPSVSISAKEGTGIDELLETILLMAELEELEANPDARASGVVIESSLDERRGNAATLLIQNGKLRTGEFVVIGEAMSPVRIFEDFLGHPIKEATFSSPVRIIGFDKPHAVGLKFLSFSSKKEAENAVKENKVSFDESKLSEKPEEKIELDTNKEVVEGRPEESVLPKTTVHLVLKADVAGSLEALKGEIEKFNSDKVKVNILKLGLGIVGKDDFKFSSSAPDLIIIAFRVGIDKDIKEILKRTDVTYQFFDIIYEVSDWLKTKVEKRLPHEVEKEDVGRAKILKIFKKVGHKQTIGGRVLDGVAKNGAKFALLRNNNKIGEGSVLDLQHGKVGIGEVEKGKEFGIQVNIEISIGEGDVLEFFEERIIKGTI